jgi:hypothetical protein
MLLADYRFEISVVWQFVPLAAILSREKVLEVCLSVVCSFSTLGAKRNFASFTQAFVKLIKCLEGEKVVSYCCNDLFPEFTIEEQSDVFISLQTALPKKAKNVT